MVVSSGGILNCKVLVIGLLCFLLGIPVDLSHDVMYSTASASGGADPAYWLKSGTSIYLNTSYDRVGIGKPPVWMFHLYSNDIAFMYFESDTADTFFYQDCGDGDTSNWYFLENGTASYDVAFHGSTNRFMEVNLIDSPFTKITRTYDIDTNEHTWYSNGTSRWILDVNGSLVPVVDKAYDIGKNNSYRVDDIYCDDLWEQCEYPEFSSRDCFEALCSIKGMETSVKDGGVSFQIDHASVHPWLKENTEYIRETWYDPVTGEYVVGDIVDVVTVVEDGISLNRLVHMVVKAMEYVEAEYASLEARVMALEKVVGS